MKHILQNYKIFRNKQHFHNKSKKVGTLAPTFLFKNEFSLFDNTEFLANLCECSDALVEVSNFVCS